MTALVDTTGYRALFEEQAARGPEKIVLLEDLRRDAFSRFEALGFPSTRMEDWKYTSVSPISKESFSLPEARSGSEVPDAALPLAGVTSTRLVFVDGVLDPGLSDPLGQDGVRLLDIASALEAGLARYADFRSHAFVALNTALFSGGAFLDVADGAHTARPIHVVHVASPAGRPTVVSPRTFVRVGRDASVALIESYASRGGNVFTNAVTEIVCGENAVVDHCRLAIGNESTLHVATGQTWQAPASLFRSTAVHLGGQLVRHESNVLLDGPGAETVLNGFYMTAGRDHVDNHTVIDHAAPHTRSRELYAGVLAGRSTAAFNGAIIVRPHAQGTAAGQRNRNLLLSDEAIVHTKPELQIHADDIKCTHGATIGQLDPDALFYLRTRGFDLGSARRVLTEAFAADVFGAIGIPQLEAALTREFRNRLSEAVGEKVHENV